MKTGFLFSGTPHKMFLRENSAAPWIKMKCWHVVSQRIFKVPQKQACVGTAPSWDVVMHFHRAPSLPLKLLVDQWFSSRNIKN